MSVSTTSDLVYLPSEGAAPPDDIGGKALGLVHIVDAGLPTPPWFVVRPAAQGVGADRADDLAEAIADACRTLQAPFAVRSSAIGEDGIDASFAGQHETVLNVPDSPAVAAALHRCWSSLSSVGARAYRAARGLAEPSEMAVIVQSLVRADVSGVAVVDPAGQDEVVINAALGLGAPLMSGEIDGDEYRVSPDERVTAGRRGRQEWQLAAGRNGSLERSPVSSAQRHCGVLTDNQLLAVARAARRLAAFLGGAQDVEWAYAGGQLFLLQTRPVIAPPVGSAGEIRVWDSSNIIESFPGITTPLTFSIAREAYAAIYPSACRAAGASPRRIEESAAAFEQLLGLLQGRVYYNLNSWYMVLSLLPCFAHSQAWMERMMGAQRPALSAGRTRRSFSRSAGTARALVILVWGLATLEREASRFRRAMESLRADFGARDLDALSIDALAGHYEAVRQRAVTAWRAPILNDLFLMVFHGALRQLAGRWLGPGSDAAVNRALRTGEMASTAPSRALEKIAAEVRANPAWLDAVRDADREPLDHFRADPSLRELWRAIDAYLKRWGDRSPEELQLDRPSFREDPLPLIRAIGDLAARPATTHVVETAAGSRVRIREDHDEHIAGGPKGLVLGFLLHRTQYHLALREEMRLTRSEVFGIARRTFARMGQALFRDGLIDEPADIHYLDISEVRSLVHGTGAIDARALVHMRRDLYASYRRSPQPPNRVETRGPVARALLSHPSDGRSPRAERVDHGSDERLRLQGIGTSPGRVRARAVIVVDPHQAHAVQGRVVVARSTDPGWLPLLLSAAGLVVEHGSTLSHSSIVARELGLPMVVGVSGATSVIATGCMLGMDGSTGEVWAERDAAATNAEEP